MNNPIEVMSFIIMFFGVIFLLFMLVFALDSLIRYYFKKKEEKFIRNHPNFIDLGISSIVWDQRFARKIRN